MLAFVGVGKVSSIKSRALDTPMGNILVLDVRLLVMNIHTSNEEVYHGTIIGGVARDFNTLVKVDNVIEVAGNINNTGFMNILSFKKVN